MPIIVSNVFPPDRGGIQTMMSALALVARGRLSDVVVVAPAMPGSAEFDSAAPYKTIRYADLRKPANMITLLAAYLYALTKAGDRTTLAANWWPTAAPLMLLPRRIRGRLGVFVHGADIAPQKGGARRLLMRYVLRHADAIMANSSFTARLVAQAGVAVPVHIVPLGVDVKPIDPSSARTPTILSVGRIIERKGFDRVIQALPILAGSFPDVRYEVVGDGPDLPRLRELASRLGVDRLVTFHGSLSDPDLRAAYARARCFALPVRAVGNDVEGFGIVYLEAAMARLPVIGGIESGAIDAIVDGVTGYLVDGNDRGAILGALDGLLRDPAGARQMGDRGFERALSHTWARTFDACESALKA